MMQTEKIRKESFSVIGKQGSTADGPGFIQKLWAEANQHFAEVEKLAKREDGGNLTGMWGAMSDVTLSFKPWEDNFSKGFYLAGVECKDDAVAPEGWTKWTIPGYVYLRIEADTMDAFPEMIAYMKEHEIPLAGAVHDFSDPVTGKNYMYFPIEKL